MPRVKIKAGDYSDVEAVKGFDSYTGPIPPKGVYKSVVKIWNLMVNGSDDHMFKILFEINEPKTSAKSRYNGYPLWHQANLTEVSAPYVNAMLDVLGIPRKAVWGNGPVVDPDGDIDDKMGVKVIKLGTRSPIGLECLVITKPNTYKKVVSQQPASFLAIPAGYGEADPDADDDDMDDEEYDAKADARSDDDDEDDDKPAKKSKADSDDDEDDDPDSF